MKIKTKDNFELDVLYHKTENAKGVVIFAHGMTVDRENEGIFVKASSMLQNLGYSTLLFDFRAHGKSQGDSVVDFTISNELVDLDAIFDFVKGEGYGWIGLAGASFGGGIVSLFAGKHPQLINKLLLANPALDFVKCFITPSVPWAQEQFDNIIERIDKNGYAEVGKNKYKLGKNLFSEMGSYNPCTALKTFTRPLLVIHGDKDTKVSFQDAFDCFQTLPNIHKKFEKIEGSEHGFHNEPYVTQVAEMITAFFV